MNAPLGRRRLAGLIVGLAAAAAVFGGALAQTANSAAAGPVMAPAAVASMSVDKTLIGDLWANQAARAVLLRTIPEIAPFVEQIKGITLRQSAPMSQGGLDDAKLKVIQDDFDKAGAAILASSVTAVTAHPDDTAAWLKDRQARFAAYRAAHPNPDSQTDLWDGADYPEMVMVPAGEYTMGSPVAEANRQANEGPRHRVRIGYSFAVGKYPITVGEFARFVEDTHYDAGDKCFTDEGGVQPKGGRNWRRPGFDQASTHPVVCMGHNDAEAYVTWLSKKTGHAYRLLSEAEYEYVARAGTRTAYSWGDDPVAACAYANGADMDTQALYPYRALGLTANTCHDGFVVTSPVGSLKPNLFGLYDTTGNAWSWLSDCWNDSYDGAPTDGSAYAGRDCGRRSLRGGSWTNNPSYLRAARRNWSVVGLRLNFDGFRVARTY
ncbi:MAG: hypothetical protein JWQ07_4240 [Ramlibacter sp.]|nr:hypothetical protein [Ramlibacter sp.]